MTHPSCETKQLDAYMWGDLTRDINPDVPAWLCGVVGKLLKKQPNDRFDSTEKVTNFLEQCLAHVQQPSVAELPNEALQLAREEETREKAETKGRSQIGRKVMFATLCIVFAGVLGFEVVATTPPKIDGTWKGASWGTVELKETKRGTFEGDYKDAFGGESGKLKLKWSRAERRYNGTWGPPDQNYGRLSIRLVGDEIRGAWKTKANADVAANVPQLGDLRWVRPLEAFDDSNTTQAQAIAATNISTADATASDEPDFVDTIHIEPRGVETTAGACQIGDCIQYLNLREVHSQTRTHEHRDGFTFPYQFAGKSGLVRVQPKMNRIFALAEPTKQIKFVLVVATQQHADLAVHQKAITYESAPAQFDYIHMDWRDREKCKITFYSSLPAVDANERHDEPHTSNKGEHAKLLGICQQRHA